MRVAPAGTATSAPTASRRVPRTTMVTFSRTLPSTPSMRRPATMAVTSVLSGRVTRWASMPEATTAQETAESRRNRARARFAPGRSR